MARIAKLFRHGHRQAVRLPAEFRFLESQVFIRRDLKTGDVILSRHPDSWEDFFKLTKALNLPSDFLTIREDVPPQKRKLF